LVSYFTVQSSEVLCGADLVILASPVGVPALAGVRRAGRGRAWGPFLTIRVQSEFNLWLRYLFGIDYHFPAFDLSVVFSQPLVHVAAYVAEKVFFARKSLGI
jgi:hypothetical protein